MGLFDSLKNQAKGVMQDAMQGIGNKTEDIVFPTVPDTFEGFIALPQAAMSTPFETAAMTVIALCVYPRAPETSVQMLNFLRGPRPLNGHRTTIPPSSPTPSGSLRITTAFSPRGWPNCLSPPAAPTVPGPSSCGRPRTANGICGSSSFSPISASRKAPTPGPEIPRRAANLHRAKTNLTGFAKAEL